MRQRVGFFGFFVVLVSAVTAITACDESALPDAPDSDAGFIAFIGPATDDPIWPTLRATAERYREGLTGFDLVTRAPEIRSSNAQIRILRELHSPQMRGLCIEPVDTRIMRDIICELQTKGVAVVTLMQRVECEDPLPFAGVDELAAGKAIAEALREAVGGEGTVAVMIDSSAGQRLSDRLLGFHERMRLVSGLTVMREMDCKGNAFVSERMIRGYMERFPRLDAWAVLDNWPLRELDPERALLPATCRLVTTAPLPRFWPRIRDRTCAALIGARYERIAESALRMCAAAARGEPLQTRTYLAPPVTVTEQNLNWYRVNWFKMRERPDGAEVEENALPDEMP